jgi:hypothetical protein
MKEREEEKKAVPGAGVGIDTIVTRTTMQTRIDRQAFVDVHLTIRAREARGTLTRVAKEIVLTGSAVLTWVWNTTKT